MNATQPEVRSSGWAIFGQVIAVVALIVAIATLRGLVLVVLWGWFVEPLGVSAINVAVAIGLGAIVGLLTQRPADKDDKRPFWEKFIPAFAEGLSGAAVALLIGWIAHLLA